jgi:hypothetical protein
MPAVPYELSRQGQHLSMQSKLLSRVLQLVPLRYLVAKTEGLVLLNRAQFPVNSRAPSRHQSPRRQATEPAIVNRPRSSTHSDNLLPLLLSRSASRRCAGRSSGACSSRSRTLARYLLHASALLKRASARPLEVGRYFLGHLVHSRRPLLSSYFAFLLL